MNFLIFGGCGFLGSNLAAEVLRRGHRLIIFDNLSRIGSEKNLCWLQTQGTVDFLKGDIRCADQVSLAVRTLLPEVVFHVAGQVAMTESIRNPQNDFEVNALGSVNILESIRAFQPEAITFFSSTNKVYGDLDHLTYEETPTRFECQEFPKGFSEEIPLSFKTPYGCSKGSADQYFLDYASTFGLRTVVFRHSSIFGGRQFSSVDQGWIGWFIKKAVESAKIGSDCRIEVSGSGKQVRDVLYAPDLVNCYFEALANPNAAVGQAFNIGGGIENSLSILELFLICNKLLNIEIGVEHLQPRQSDQKVFISDITKASNSFGWRPKIDKHAAISQMLDWVLSWESQTG